MNVASLLKTPRIDAPPPSALKLLRVEARVLAQALVGSARDRVLAFRFMRGVGVHGGAAVPPEVVSSKKDSGPRALA